MLPAKDVVAVEDDFIKVLQHVRGTKEQKQAYFSSRGIRVPRTNYESMWAVLTQRLQRGGAASAVFELLRAGMPRHLSLLFRQVDRGKAVRLRSTEPAIVFDFFFQNGNVRKIGELFIQDLREHGGSLATIPPKRAVSTISGKRYEIALSFSGEDRTYVDQIADILKSMRVRIFYDAFERVSLLGKDLATHFAWIYGKRADYCAMFISRDYVRKAWPNFERQHALSRAILEKREYILPIRLDDSEVPGLPPTVGYLDARGYTPKQVAQDLFHKVRGTQT
ncbi:MAG: TIR domain-containing protein [Acidobacteriia bacterium]|nr:TIR domain-containing protein [Terriglobia bacterium]